MTKKRAAQTDTKKKTKIKLFHWSKKFTSLLHILLTPIFLLLLALLKIGRLPTRIAKNSLILSLKISFRLSFFLLLLILLGYSIILLKLSVQLPSPDSLSPTQRPLTTQIYDREGRLLYQVYEGRNRTLVKLEELPPYLLQATIAIEDKHFYSHRGIDLEGIIRALSYNLKENNSQDSRQGGSTITQQLIKNTMLTPDKTYTRKLKEILLSLWAEIIFSKKEILQMYFNEIAYGGPAWGIEEASKMYFDKSAKELNLAESAYLAGLPAAPSELSPYGAYPEEGKKRQKEVLRRMVEDKYLTQEQANQAAQEKLAFKPPLINIKAPHFVMYARSLLASKYGEKTVSQGGLKVVTTLDLDIQEMAEKVVLEEVEKLAGFKVSNGAAMVTDGQTGQVLAMVGSKDYFDPQGGNFNATLSLRPPGSSIKPVTYVTSFKEGFSPGTIILDTPTTFPNPWGKPYSPVNYDGRFHGPVTIRAALGSSYNVPAVKILATVGLPAMLQTAKEMGINTLTDTKNYGLSLTLGGGGVKMLEMMAVYGTLASGGIRHGPQVILTVIDSNGVILEDNRVSPGKQVITEEIAYLINNILSDKNARIPAFGPNSLLEIKDHPSVAVKTGTSDEKRDNWAFGYTPNFVVGAWVGNFNNSPMHPTLSSGITGATPIWHRIMSNLLQNQPDLVFKRPKGIIEAVAHGKKDIAISGQTPKTVVFSKKIKQKDDKGEEKEIISFTDQFNTFIPNQVQATQ